MPEYNIPKVELSGSSYEIGLTHGRLLAAQIVSQIGIYRNLFMINANAEWPQVLAAAEAFHSTIGTLAPELLEEMRGIADGVGRSDVGLLDIVAINSRSEISLGKWGDGCTSLSWKLRDSGRQILAQNWDMPALIGPNLALASIKQSGKPDIWMVLEPGIVGKIGFNTASVGVCLNAIRSRPISTSKLPIHLLLRIALQCDSVDSAISTIERLGGSASSEHVMIADIHGGRGLELAPSGNVYLVEDENGIITHTNHFIENIVADPLWSVESPPRLARARTLCEEIRQEKGGNLADVDTALLRGRVFSDVENMPCSICAAPSAERDGAAPPGETLFNIVMVFEEGKTARAEVVFGRPGSGMESAVYSMPW